MKYRYLLLISLMIFLVQTTFMQFLRIGGVIPNLSLIFVVSFAAIHSKREALGLAVFLGAFQDLFASKVLSINLMIYVAIVFIIGSSEEHIFEDNILTPLVLMIVSTLFYHLVYSIAMFFLGNPIFASTIIEMVLKETVYNVVTGMVIYTMLFKNVYGYNLR